MGRIKWIATSMLCASVVAEAAVKVDLGPKFFSPTDEVESPHIKWAKPDAQGKLKVLFITWLSGMREVVELRERMDIETIVFAVADASKFYDAGACVGLNISQASKVAELEKKLDASYDLIVMGNVNWETLPLPIKYLILKKVKEGTSLFGKINGTDDYLKRATTKRVEPEIPMLVPVKGLPAYKEFGDAKTLVQKTVEAFEFGKGRIVLLKVEPAKLQALTPKPSGKILELNRVEYDYYLGYVAHLMQWAARRMPKVEMGGECFVRAQLGSAEKIRVSIRSAGKRRAQIEYVARSVDRGWIVEGKMDVVLQPGENIVELERKPTPAGSYYVDIWVKQGGKIDEFGSIFMEVTGPVQIEELNVSNCWKRNETVKGKVKIGCQAGKESGLKLVVKRTDTDDRVTGRQAIDVGELAGGEKKEVAFELAQDLPMTIIQCLDVELVKGSDVLDRKRLLYSISDLNFKNDIRLILWATGYTSYSDLTMTREWASWGVDTYYEMWGFTENLPLANIRYMPYATRLIDRKTDWYSHPDVRGRTADDHVRSPCLSDPKYIQEESDKLRKKLEGVRVYSVNEATLGDESFFASGNHELCFSETCVAGFHRFLKNEYETVAAMNKEYGTECKSFDEVQPVTKGDLKEKPNLRPLWVDYRRHMEDTWAGAFTRFRDVMNEVVPGIKVGYEGSDTEINSYRAADYWKLMQQMQINGTYDGAFVPYAVKDFSRPGSIIGLGWYGCYGETRNEEFQRYIVWRHLFRGANSFWSWMCSPASIGSVMAPDLSFCEWFKASLKEVQEVKGGVGRLFMESERENDGIGILYSASSVHVATLTPGLPSMQETLNGLIPLFEDSGHQFKILSYKQVAEGILKQGKYAVLVLPYTQAISRKEAKAIEEFAQNGGTVIADLRPGVCDEHGKAYEGGGILDKVFGVKQRTEGPIATNCEAMINLEGYAKTLKNVTCDWSLSLGTGQAKALVGQGDTAVSFEKPAVIVNRYGNGNAILLNFSLSRYASVKGSLESSAVAASAEAPMIMDFFKNLMKQAKKETAVEVLPELPGMKIYRFHNGENTFLGMLQDLPEPMIKYVTKTAKPLRPKPVTLTIKQGKRHVYDMRGKGYLGFTDEIRTEIEPSRARLFGLLPYRVTGVEIQSANKVSQGGDLTYQLRLKTEGSEPGIHVIRVIWIGPDGKERKHYGENLVVEKGQAEGRIRLALNDQPGKWKARARDVISLLETEKEFEVLEVK